MHLTPLRYPGGKAKIARYVESLFKENNLCDGHYVEPYAGGAGVALQLLFTEHASHIHINDIDPAIYSFWRSVLDDTDTLCELIEGAEFTVENWRKQQAILKDMKRHSMIEIGFATFFLNRTNRSGILNAGVIGGLQQTGQWKMDARFNKEELIKRIKLVASYKARISLYNEDAVMLLKRLNDELPQKTLIYLDPPYYVKGAGLYRNFYTHEDHVNIEKQLEIMNGRHWIVSYDNVAEIKEIYKNYRQLEYSLTYSAQQKMQGSEVMVYSDSISYDKEVKPFEPLRRKKTVA